MPTANQGQQQNISILGVQIDRTIFKIWLTTLLLGLVALRFFGGYIADTVLAWFNIHDDAYARGVVQCGMPTHFLYYLSAPLVYIVYQRIRQEGTTREARLPRWKARGGYLQG
ncbi:hypothetical protein CLAFUW4_07762 [Fulvia fulva]|uniref:Uncharacterized protein n=1 Tax=Passalora fulva TaxID=5499 RepID=A0A9Q8LDG5_PASFU|nr:uncharacterized protein CLAFUR5_07887 [Fulvia fulva]KAK4629052.1 hypothetical protein CLAFUR4_07767 [Fulvia fulva]KAK4630109.1 hypothetical protein CLAFUR0_07765 [Fulvia fulva]UJO15204.1 hypothetical protein CLAFUR5_07887 [Fulvia fulva]WPV13063.1 hypothetical protein CLAFUW4_07762 [Fulvia fulva]WPV27209.1 hypothetical protein CLAFUW7_07763 [Fulvia fulva]